MMRAGTIFSGIGAPECSSPGIDWRWAAEIDPFASAVHAARFPGVPNLGNVLEIDWHAVEPVDLVVGGPPCQDYSVAGQRASLSGARGDLTLQYARILDAIDPAWSVTENVPGWLSTGDNAFGAFLGILVGSDAALVPGIGQRWTDAGVVSGPKRTAAWRILDAQYFGVPQRRRRVFVVACRGAGNFACAEALLPLRTSLHRDTAPRRETREDVAATIAPGSHPGGITGREAENGALIAFDWDNSAGGPNSEDTFMTLGSRREPAVAVPLLEIGKRTNGDGYRDGDGIGHDGDPMYSLQAGAQHGVAVAFDPTARQPEWSIGRPLKTDGPLAVLSGMSVRRLTPRECERLQGFPDGWTDVPYRGKPAADGPMYRAIGNSMAVPVIGWVLARVQEIAAAALEEAA